MIKKITPILMALVMMFSFSFGALAATSDPNVTGYNTSWTQVFGTNQLQISSGSTTNLQVGPANNGWVFTGYDTAADALNDLTWSIVPGGTVDAYIASNDVVAASGGKYAARAVIGIAEDSPSGSVLVQATRDNGQAVYFTIVVNQTNFLNIIVPENGITIGTRFYDGFVSSTPLASASSLDVTPANYGDSRSFNTVFDALGAANALNVVDAFGIGSSYLSSVTINSIQYADSWLTGEIWQFRVYRDTNGDGIYEKQDLSTLFLLDIERLWQGNSDSKLQDGDIVIFNYGPRSDSFPATI